MSSPLTSAMVNIHLEYMGMTSGTKENNNYITDQTSPRGIPLQFSHRAVQKFISGNQIHTNRKKSIIKSTLQKNNYPANITSDLMDEEGSMMRTRKMPQPVFLTSRASPK